VLAPYVIAYTYVSSIAKLLLAAAAAAAHVANAQLHTSALRVARSPILAPNGISAPSAFCDRFSSRHGRGGYYMITHLPY